MRFALVTACLLGTLTLWSQSDNSYYPEPGDHSVDIGINPFGWLQALFEDDFYYGGTPASIGLSYRSYHEGMRATNHSIYFYGNIGQDDWQPYSGLHNGMVRYSGYSLRFSYLARFEKIHQFGERWQLLYGPQLGFGYGISATSKEWDIESYRLAQQGITETRTQEAPDHEIGIRGGYGAELQYYLNQHFFLSAKASIGGNLDFEIFGVRTVEEIMPGTVDVTEEDRGYGIDFDMTSGSSISLGIGLVF